MAQFQFRSCFPLSINYTCLQPLHKPHIASYLSPELIHLQNNHPLRITVIATFVTSASTIMLNDQLAADAEFPQFPKFPGEIRIKIWDYAAHHPRDVQLSICGSLQLVDDDQETKKATGSCHVVSLNPVPGLLHACVESRYEGLKTYKKSFIVPGKAEGIAYVNPSIDTLFIRIISRSCLPVYWKLLGLQYVQFHSRFPFLYKSCIARQAIPSHTCLIDHYSYIVSLN